MELVTSFEVVLQSLSPVMTAPSFDTWLTSVTDNCSVTSRAVLDAPLPEAPPTPKPGRRGKKLPTPRQMLSERCRRIHLSIYGRSESARVADAEARMFAVPERPLRFVAAEAVVNGRGMEAFYSTVVDVTAEQVLTWCSMRWSLEVTFHDSKQHLGFEKPPGKSEEAVQRTAPMAMLLYTAIVHWYALEGRAHENFCILPWYTKKSQPSFADMLARLKRISLRQRISAIGLSGRGSRKTQQLLESLVNLAA